MKALLLLSLLFFSGTLASRADEEESVKACRAHLKNIFTGNAEALEKSFAAEVTLMPGDEFLDPDYGFAKDKDRKESAKVTGKALTQALLKKVDSEGKPPQEEMDKLFATLKFEPLEVKEGDFPVEPSEKVETPDGKLHFKVVKDDVIFKVGPPEEKTVLLHLRKVDGHWVVVSEFLH